MGMYEDVRTFHRKMNIPIGESPTFLSRDDQKSRCEFIREELHELEKALNDDDIVEASDALVDIVYATLGFALRMGLPWNRLWDEVHAANMRKVGGATARMPWDAIKPEGWESPDLETILDDEIDRARAKEGEL